MSVIKCLVFRIICGLSTGRVDADIDQTRLITGTLVFYSIQRSLSHLTLPFAGENWSGSLEINAGQNLYFLTVFVCANSFIPFDRQHHGHVHAHLRGHP